MNKTIDLYFLIDKYFEQIDECVQFVNNIKTPYTEAQVIQKAHHMVLPSGIYVDACK